MANIVVQPKVLASQNPDTYNNLIMAQAQNATNVTTNINGNPITDIFESNGLTVKNATNAANATNATNAANATNATNAIKLPNGTFEAFTKNNNNVLFANGIICSTFELLYDSVTTPTYITEAQGITLNNDIDTSNDIIIFDISYNGSDNNHTYVVANNSLWGSNILNLTYKGGIVTKMADKESSISYYSANVVYNNRNITLLANSYLSAVINITFPANGNVTSTYNDLNGISVNRVYRLII